MKKLNSLIIATLLAMLSHKAHSVEGMHTENIENSRSDNPKQPASTILKIYNNAEKQGIPAAQPQIKTHENVIPLSSALSGGLPLSAHNDAMPFNTGPENLVNSSNPFDNDDNEDNVKVNSSSSSLQENSAKIPTEKPVQKLSRGTTIHETINSQGKQVTEIKKWQNYSYNFSRAVCTYHNQK